MKRTDDETLIQALRLLARDIISEDGVARSVIMEAADRINEQAMALRVISTWARCDNIRAQSREDAMQDIAEKCESVLVRKQVRK